VTVGVTTGNDPSANLLRLVSEKITVMGSIMGTLEEMNNMIRLVIVMAELARDRRGDAHGGDPVHGRRPHPRQDDLYPLRRKRFIWMNFMTRWNKSMVAFNNSEALSASN
jgi:hypothetical protein